MEFIFSCNEYNFNNIEPKDRCTFFRNFKKILLHEIYPFKKYNDKILSFEFIFPRFPIHLIKK